MGLFGDKGDDGDKAEALRSDLHRLEGLAIPALALEILTKGFGPGGPGEDPEESVTVSGPNIDSGVGVRRIAGAISPAREADESADPDAARLIDRIVAEGVQALEHAGLIRCQMHTAMNGLDYALTRLGRKSIADRSAQSLLGA